MSQFKKKKRADEDTGDSERLSKSARLEGHDTFIEGSSGGNHSPTRRTTVLRDHVDPANNIYSVAHLPAVLRWGQSDSGQDYTGDRFNAVSVGILPLMSDDLLTIKGVLRDRSHPQIDIVAATDIVYASAFLSTRDNINADDFTVKKFNEIYDSTKTFTAKSKMEKIVPAALHTNDVILVEAYVKRYRIKDEDTSSDKTIKPRDNSWQNWKASLDLISISQLLLGEPDPLPEVSASFSI
ncbi:hypothetical protein A0H81_04989 [Grifola frondosa]|uniref:Uncharacterized protein n=1 Tax=Grifola frondosa TaxID=5627 RepID=A0A1C7MED4_GRIFR|nr:hypothetical protein A0H81_04989 [Grifola frondosa]